MTAVFECSNNIVTFETGIKELIMISTLRPDAACAPTLVYTAGE